MGLLHPIRPLGSETKQKPRQEKNKKLKNRMTEQLRDSDQVYNKNSYELSLKALTSTSIF